MKKLVSESPFRSVEEAEHFVQAIDDKFPKSGAETVTNGYNAALFVRVSEKHLVVAKVFLCGFLAGEFYRANAVLRALQA